MIERCCPTHGRVLRDLRCPKRHRCSTWNVVRAGLIIGRGSEQAAQLFRGLLEPRPGDDRKPMPTKPCGRGHMDWKFRGHRGLEGGWFCGTCPKLTRYERRKLERARRKKAGRPPLPRRAVRVAA